MATPDTALGFAKEEVEIERSVYNWAIPEFSEVFEVLNQRKTAAASRTGRGRGSVKEKRCDISELELVSETFIRGQLVHQTSIWQVELRRNGAYLCVGLSCLQCFHENVDSIWTRFDIDIVDFNGEVRHSQGSGAHFCSDNITKFTPLSKIGDKAQAKMNMRCSFWETDAISLNDLQKNWKTLVPLDILNLRLRLYIYKDEPFDEATHLSEFHEPVQLCYTDDCTRVSENNISLPILQPLKSLWESKEGADVIFKVDGEEINAHKLIVSLQSPVLKNEILNQKEKPFIEIDSVSSEEFKHALKFMYTQDATDLKASSDISFITAVLDASNLLEIPSLARICLVRLMTNLTIENFAETAFIIYSKVKQDQSYFKTEIKRFLMENQKELCKSEEFMKKAKEEVKSFLQLCFEPLDVPIAPVS